VWLPTLDELFAALAGSGEPRLLGEIHVALLRVVQVLLLPSEQSSAALQAAAMLKRLSHSRSQASQCSSFERAVAQHGQFTSPCGRQHIPLPAQQEGAAIRD